LAALGMTERKTEEPWAWNLRTVQNEDKHTIPKAFYSVPTLQICPI
jgi:hypothetical protein